MNDLKKYFTNNEGGLIDKWTHYFEIYDNYFSHYRNSQLCILEIGVSQGGSLQMWKKYFGKQCKVYGVDINPQCKELEEEQIEIIIGDQEDKKFLLSLKNKIPKIDILIDDGGHTMNQQINTFEILFPHINKNGIYLCEDLHTSYQSKYHAGYKRSNTFIEYSKNFIDYINAWHSESPLLNVSNFTKSVHSIHYYDSIVVIEKREGKKPYSMETGKERIPKYYHPISHEKYYIGSFCLNDTILWKLMRPLWKFFINTKIKIGKLLQKMGEP